MKLCIKPRSDCSLGLECFHSYEFIFDSDFYPRENWTLGRIYPWLRFYPWLGFYPWVGIYPWLGMILDSDWILGSDWILSSDFTLGKIGASVEFILGSDFLSSGFFDPQEN